jgi:hypothetical protein
MLAPHPTKKPIQADPFFPTNKKSSSTLMLASLPFKNPHPS